MAKIINFDMDGTLADLYAVPNWLEKLRNYDIDPYVHATPLLSLSRLARYIHKVQDMGYEVNILSWLSKDPDPDYGEAVKYAKMGWLQQHLPSVKFDHIFILPYGVPKENISEGILFDDELPNREKWNEADEQNHAYDETVVFDVLKIIAAGEL